MMPNAASSDPGSHSAAETSPHFHLHPQHLESGAASYADLILSLAAHDGYFTDIKKFPEADIRDRFLRERSIRARYVEWLIMVQRSVVDQLHDDVRMQKVDANDEEFRKKHAIAMQKLDEVLRWSSRNDEDDSRAANAPVVDPIFMDHFRIWLEKPGRGPRAPNGIPRSEYGSRGDPVEKQYFSLRDLSNDPFRRLILDRLMTPFNHFIWVPLQGFFNSLLGRDQVPQPQALGQGTLDALVTTLECVVATICFAACVTLLYNLESTKSRLVAAPFASFICVVPTIFLSKEAKSFYTLMAATWSVIIVIVFLSNANCNGKSQ